MPATSAVLLDYGRTLATFEYPQVELARVIERFRPEIAAATGRPAPSVDETMQTVLLPLEALVENPSEDEVPYMDVFEAAWRRAGIELPPDLLWRILDAEQRVWDAAAHVEPEGLAALAWLRDHGIKSAVCSNAPFPPAMMLRQVEGNGVAALVDAVVFSSQIGRRKPAREMYLAALGALHVAPRDALFVGDRVREDYEGPCAVGMRAVICTRHAAESPGPGVPTIESLSRLAEIL